MSQDERTNERAKDKGLYKEGPLTKEDLIRELEGLGINLSTKHEWALVLFHNVKDRRERQSVPIH